MIRGLFRCERGNSFVEMALMAPLLATLLIGMVDISRGVSAKLKAVQVAQRIVEKVQRSGFQPSQASALETEAETAAGVGSNATVTSWLECGTSTARLSFTATCSPGQPYSRHMEITLTNTFMPVFGTNLIPGANPNGSYTVQGRAGVRVQ
jgi:Flp pilus assembly pilin Flp